MTSQPLAERIRLLFEGDRFHLPVSPFAADQLLTGSSSGRSFEGSLIDLVGLDPALACNLFRAANSAFYQGLPKATTLGEALNRIGCDGTAEMLGQCCRHGNFPAHGYLLPRYLPPLWRHSLGCALGARWLAMRCGYRGLAETAYLAGLLHDVGKWLLLALLEEIAGGDDCLPLADQLVEEVLASLHVELGVRLVTAWNLPDDPARVVGRHHLAQLDSQDLVVALVRLANLGCRKLGLGWVHDTGLVLPTTAEAQFLGLDEFALAEFEIMLEDRFGLVPASTGCD